MSFDIELLDPVTKKVIQLPAKHYMAGGIREVGGTTRAWLNVTYNYSRYFNFSSIYGLTGAESFPLLKQVASKLKNDVDKDYWKPTEGNTKQAILQLIAFAEMRPDGIWGGD